MSTTVKLTERIRSEISKRLIDQKFGQRIKDNLARRKEIGLKIYEAKFSAADMHKMAELPKGWLSEVKTIRARLGGLDFGVELDKGVIMPANCCDGYGNQSNFLLNETSGKLAEAFIMLDRDEKDVKSESERLKQEIRGVMYSITTANKLVTVWPEIKPTVDLVCKTYTVNANLPAPRIDDLNRSLGLRAA